MDQENKWWPPLSFQVQWSMEKTGRSSRSIPASEIVVTGRILGLFIMGHFMQHQACKWQVGYHCLTSLGLSRAHWKSFKIYLREEKDKTRLARGVCVSSRPKFGGQCASKVLGFAVSVTEIHEIAKAQGTRELQVCPWCCGRSWSR